jgi:tetratricopeptide (TPR) repeat protein
MTQQPQGPPYGLPVPRQLPAMPSWFAGREDELRRLSDVANDDKAAGGQSVVISAVGGAGGIGKTCLGLRWAYQNLERFPDGQLFVDLHGFDPVTSPLSPATAVRGFLDAFEVAVNRIPAALDAQIGLYRSLISGRRMLIFIDNAYDAEQVLPLLPGASSCTVIITSRRQLVSLVTGYNARPLPLDALSEEAAREVLAQRIGAQRVDAEPASAAELAAYCAGLPLALAIVAARITMSPSLSLAKLAGELRARRSRLSRLDGGDDRSSLTSVFSWSYRSLQPGVARTFCMLGLAPGPDIGLQAAAGLLGEPPSNVADALDELERASLVQQYAPGRWRMHDLVKLYAAQTAETTLSVKDRLTCLERLVAFYLHSAYAADRLINPRRPAIQFGAPPANLQVASLQDKEAAQEWLGIERLCLIAAHDLAGQQGWDDAVWQLAWALDTFHYRRGHLNDRIKVLQAGLQATLRSRDEDGSFMAYRLLGHAYVRVGNYDAAIAHLNEALAIATAAGDLLNEAHTHTFFIKAWGQQGDDRQALEHAQRALEIFQNHGNPAWVVQSLNFVGWHSARLGLDSSALQHCLAALAISREHHDHQGEADALNSLGYVAHLKNEYREAIAYYLQALDLFHELGHDYYEAEVLDRLGESHLGLGHQDAARDSWQQALALYRRQERAAEAAKVLEKLAESL